uniref:Reverse transcriptase zinc-binding domain-containing protein n=1 Tax=Latimeria chalumnae TaxID=7897 RepID=H3AJN3_LATCH
STHLNADSFLWENPAILVQGKPVLWASWVAGDICRIGDVWGPEGVLSFTTLRENFDLLSAEFLHYLQMKHSLNQHRALTPGMLQPSPINELQRMLAGKRGVASKIYAFLLNKRSPSRESTRKAWEVEFELTFTEDVWEEALVSTLAAGTDIKSRLIQFNIVNHIYWTPAKLSSAKLLDTDRCWRCGTERGSLLHMLWACSKLQHYWTQICTFLGSLVKIDAVDNPLACVLGVGIRGTKLPKGEIRFVKMALVTAKRVILRHWRQVDSPTFQEWFLAMAETASHERVILKVRNKLDLFDKVWSGFLPGT